MNKRIRKKYAKRYPEREARRLMRRIVARTRQLEMEPAPLPGPRMVALWRRTVRDMMALSNVLEHWPDSASFSLSDLVPQPSPNK